MGRNADARKERKGVGENLHECEKPVRRGCSIVGSVVPTWFTILLIGQDEFEIHGTRSTTAPSPLGTSPFLVQKAQLYFSRIELICKYISRPTWLTDAGWATLGLASEVLSLRVLLLVTKNKALGTTGHSNG